MKKTLVALAVLAAAGSVSAAEVYNNDGVSVAVSGSVEVQAIQGYEDDGVNTDDFDLGKSDGKIRLDDGDLTITTAINIQEGLDVVGGLSFDLAGDRDAGTDKLYVGFASSDFGTVTFGRQTVLADDDGIDRDYELGFGQYSSGWQTETADEVIKYVYDNGQYYGAVAQNIKATDDNDSSTTQGVEITEGRLGARFGGLDARVYYAHREQEGTAITTYTIDAIGDVTGVVTPAVATETDSYNLELEYTIDALTLGASYGNHQQQRRDTGADIEDVKHIEAVAAYTMDKATYALGYVYSDDDVSDTETNNVYANVTYKLHDNVKAYAEVGYADQDTDGYNNPDIDLGYLVGMEVNF